MKKWNLFNRLWHWLNFILVIALILTAGFEDTCLKKEMFYTHSMIGFVFFALFVSRLIYMITGKDKKNWESSIKTIYDAKELITKKKWRLSYQERYIAMKAGAKLSYLGLIFCFLLVSITGSFIHFYQNKMLKEIHEVSSGLIIAFAIMHLIGVIHAELTHEKNIVSDMINGG